MKLLTRIPGAVTGLPLVLLCLTPLASAQEGFSVTALKDPVTGRSITRYQSPRHETHHYYFISPWSPDEKRIAFFQFEQGVDKLTARGRFPGAIWVMDADGGNRRKLVDKLLGHYHVGVNLFWGPTGQYIYYSDVSSKRKCLPRVDAGTGKMDCIDTPFPCSRLSPDNQKLSCGTAAEFGVYDIKKAEYKRLVTVERALALTPNKALAVGRRSQLPNNRFSPTGDKAIVVHRTAEDYPKLVEMFVYDFKTEQLTYLTHNLHHPAWRPDGKAVLFVRWDDDLKMQGLWEIDVNTLQEKPVFNKIHVPGVHASYHPLKQHLVVIDCYGGEFGNGLAIVDLKKNEMIQLVTVPLGSKPEAAADDRFPFRNWGLFMPPQKYLNEPRPVWNKDGTKILFTSEESGHMNMYVVDTSDLQ